MTGAYRLNLRMLAKMKSISTSTASQRSWPCHPTASAQLVILIVLFNVAACTGSPTTLAMRPDFEIMTPAGLAGVSIREAPYGMTDEEYSQLVRIGMEQAAPGSVKAGAINPPFPERRIVWHVNTAAPTPGSRLLVNVFDGTGSYAYKDSFVENGASAAEITSVIESLYRDLLAVIAADAQASTHVR
jgi:hypothetical protein